jgi:hypothetical protein
LKGSPLVEEDLITSFPTYYDIFKKMRTDYSYVEDAGLYFETDYVEDKEKIKIYELNPSTSTTNLNWEEIDKLLDSEQTESNKKDCEFNFGQSMSLVNKGSDIEVTHKNFELYIELKVKFLLYGQIKNQLDMLKFV